MVWSRIKCRLEVIWRHISSRLEENLRLRGRNLKSNI